jgi:hypothetical protein
MLNAKSIASVAIYPPIGVARVGNAEGADDFFFAAEVAGAAPQAPGGFRDAQGHIKRQAVRFRVYAKLHSGEFVELTAGAGATIEWRVEIANLKAGWYEFNQAMDLPDGMSKPAARRNRDERYRERLDIRPAPKVIAGRSKSGPAYAFTEGQFQSKFVYLGELRTDDEGRLIFLGGRGASAPSLKDLRPLTFANNDRWHDDVADGPVRARVTVGGVAFDAEPAYVVVTPPNFAPGLTGLVTMNDTVREVFQDAGWLAKPSSTSFSRDVWPIFDRLTGLQWINQGLFLLHGAGSPLDARSPDVIERMRNAGTAGAAWRARAFALFRDPAAGGEIDYLRLPDIYGDAFGENDEHARARLALAPTQYAHLARWAAGEFTDDWTGVRALPRFEDLPPARQVQELEQCGLHECLGGPFHPGIELSWPMRVKRLWKAPYRLNLVEEGTPVKQDFGRELTPELCLAAFGPLAAAGPGALTRWLGIPWQTDEASCNSAAEYAPSTFLSIPSYWGARVPDQVLSSESWERASAGENGTLQALKHFAQRSDWLRDVRDVNYYNRIKNMVANWWTLGILEERGTPAPRVAEGLPERALVESGRTIKDAIDDPKVALVRQVEQINEPAAMGAMKGPQKPLRGPRRTFRQGEI